MTSVQVQRILTALSERTGKLEMSLHFASSDSLDIETFEWLNQGHGGLDVILVARDGARVHYIDVTDISAISVRAPRARELMKK
jgi:hypothetical protein